MFRPEAFVIHVENPPLTSKEKPGSINDEEHPGTMFEIMEREGAILGQIEGTNSYRTMPGSPHIPEDDPEAVQDMLTIRKDKLAAVKDLSIEELTPICDEALFFLNNHTNPLCGYNNSPDVTTDNAMSWKNFHLMRINRPRTMRSSREFSSDQRKKYDKKIREIGWRSMNAGLSHLFAAEQPQYAHLARLDSMTEIDGIMPMGGVRFRLKKGIVGAELAAFMKYIDASYEAKHKELMSLFVSNYDSSVQTRGRIPYAMRGYEDIMKNITGYANENRFGNDANKIAGTLRRVGREFRGYTDGMNRQHKVIVGPTYSGVVIREADQLVYVFGAHFTRPRGHMETIGLYPERVTVEGATLAGRRQRAQELGNRVAHPIFDAHTDQRAA